MNSQLAQNVIEALRKGIPPNGFVRHFTVGRKSEIEYLETMLLRGEGNALLLKANYGSGKTHLLRFIRETALEMGYVVSVVSLDARGAIRFNRMDQMLGAINRNLEIPQNGAGKGIRLFLDSIRSQIEINKGDSHEFWNELTSNNRWHYSEALDSSGLYVAIRAWCTGIQQIQDIVEDWLFQPWVYKAQRKMLYQHLIEVLRQYFRDPRPEWKFYADGTFVFDSQGYDQCWAILRDLYRLSIESQYKGLVILFDEYEDIITNIKNIAHKEAAFWNLFRFYSGKSFPGMTFYAVTPEFVAKCKSLLLEKERFDFDYDLFDRIPTFQMSPLGIKELVVLSQKIIETHGIAYGWRPNLKLEEKKIEEIVKQCASQPIQDRARQTIISVVKCLDLSAEALD